MATRSRIRRVILITGTTLSLLIAAAFVVSAWWFVALQVPTSRQPAIYVLAGSVTFVADRDLVFVQPHSLGLVRWNGWTFGLRGIIQRMRPTITNPYYLEIPLYVVFLAVALPTLLVWRFGRKPVQPGHCRCGYDLTGNESGVCPECGQPFEPKGDAP